MWQKICYMIQRGFGFWDSLDAEKKNIAFSAILFFGILIFSKLMLLFVFIFWAIRWLHIADFFKEWSEEYEEEVNEEV